MKTLWTPITTYENPWTPMNTYEHLMETYYHHSLYREFIQSILSDSYIFYQFLSDSQVVSSERDLSKNIQISVYRYIMFVDLSVYISF